LLTNISSGLAVLFAGTALFLPFSALYVKFRYSQYVRIFECLYCRPAYSQKRIIITKIIETVLYALCSYSMIALSEFERAQQSVISTTNIGLPPLVMANTYLFYADESNSTGPRTCKIFVAGTPRSKALPSDPCLNNAPARQQKRYAL